MLLAGAVFLALTRLVAALKVKSTLRRVHSDRQYQTVECTVTFVKESRNVGFLTKRVYTWLHFDDDGDDADDLPTSAEKVHLDGEAILPSDDTSTNDTGRLRECMLKLFEDEEEDRPSDRDLLNVVLTAPEDGISVGDKIQVVLEDGNITKAFYPPYLRRTMCQHVYGILKCIFVLGCCVGTLMLLMPGVPVAFASSSQVETAVLDSWFCRTDDDDHGDSNLNGDQGPDIDSWTSECCSIPWHVAWAYTLCVAFPIYIVCQSAVSVILKVRSVVGGYRPVAVATNDDNDELNTTIE